MKFLVVGIFLAVLAFCMVAKAEEVLNEGADDLETAQQFYGGYGRRGGFGGGYGRRFGGYGGYGGGYGGGYRRGGYGFYG